jgi:hypothetical protein
MIRFTGEYVDWDNDTTFCGLFGTVFTIPGMGPETPSRRMDV